MISTSLRCIFVHIPKCAGTSVESILWPAESGEAELKGGLIGPFCNRYQTGELQHLHAEQIRRIVDSQAFKGYFKFAIVRNPFDRAVSQFVYMKKRPRLRTFLGMSANSSFDEYVALLSSVVHVQWEPQYRFLTASDTGEMLVDEVVRFENLVPEMLRVLDRLGVRCESFPKLNAGVRGFYRDFYSQRSRRIAENFYARDLELFNYEF